jgi:hypothetical protein
MNPYNINIQKPSNPKYNGLSLFNHIQTKYPPPISHKPETKKIKAGTILLVFIGINGGYIFNDFYEGINK